MADEVLGIGGTSLRCFDPEPSLLSLGFRRRVGMAGGTGGGGGPSSSWPCILRFGVKIQQNKGKINVELKCHLFCEHTLGIFQFACFEISLFLLLNYIR